MNEAILSQIKPFLEQLQPMPLLPTGAVARYRRHKSVQAVIFDIYGTLLLSASGDVMRAGFNPQVFKKALNSSGITICVPEAGLAQLQTIFSVIVNEGKGMARAGGIPFPDLDVVEVWRKTLKQAEKQGLVAGTDRADMHLFSFVFELCSNQLWPMPGLRETVSGLARRGYPLGLVSNAQFYTPVILNYFVHGSLRCDEQVPGFEPDLTTFSYKLLKGKPDPAIFETLLDPLRRRGLQPEQVLFVGNDMLKDIYPAQQLGFKTCFFAGDQRAYRLRADHPQASKLKPDMVITDLRQLLELL